jgi:hypothetical protein
VTRWRGLKDLLVDAVRSGVTAVEVVHRRTARTTIAVVASVPGLRGPAQAVGALLDEAIGGTYETIRQVNDAVGVVAGLVLDAAERLPAGPTATPELPHGRDVEKP